ncbi:MAG TPA: chemotaxis protein CheW [Usitatibacteraceae bacterium]|nr:chemotaxis protein CheW [Usitatibacteraceae bacterium]
MARKTSLREFQQNVAQRLRELAGRKTSASKLGFQVGAENWLVNLTDVSEVIPVPAIAAVPLTQPWFRGVANVRGKLYSIADLARLHGGEATGPGMDRRVILISDRLVEGSGLLVSRMLGLRNPDQFTRDNTVAPLVPWAGSCLRDQSGATWFELDLPKLAASAAFLEVGSSAPRETVAPSQDF